jgi:predicted DNA-binding transcriptional regulator YafY
MPRETADTVLRYLAMLQYIPAHPRSVSVKEIHAHLMAQSADFAVTERTIQRDLEKLSISRNLGLTCENHGKKQLWFYRDKNALLLIPGMSQQTALAFNLSEDYLKELLPASTLKLLSAYFSRAQEVLEKSKLKKWSRNIRAITRGPNLEPPRIDPVVQDAIYEGLLEEKQITVKYKARSADQEKEYILHPLGLVSRSGSVYLVATVWDYADPRHFMINRIRKATLMEERSKRSPDFDLDTYIRETGEFAYPYSDKQLKLELIFDRHAGYKLLEFKLSPDQKVTELGDDKLKVTATVRDNQEIRWWLLDFGDKVEILKPASLRKEFREIANNMTKMYQ